MNLLVFSRTDAKRNSDEAVEVGIVLIFKIILLSQIFSKYFPYLLCFPAEMNRRMRIKMFFALDRMQIQYFFA